MKNLELSLLKMWRDANVYDKIYKYKNRIKVYRGALDSITLLYDVSYKMFDDLPDIATYENTDPKDFARDIEDLIQSRTEPKDYCKDLILSIFEKYKADEPITQSTRDSISSVERYLRLTEPKKEINKTIIQSKILNNVEVENEIKEMLNTYTHDVDLDEKFEKLKKEKHKLLILVNNNLVCENRIYHNGTKDLYLFESRLFEHTKDGRNMLDSRLLVLNSDFTIHDKYYDNVWDLDWNEISYWK